ILQTPYDGPPVILGSSGRRAYLLNMGRLLLVSNRLPVTLSREQGEVRVEPSSGGLATGLSKPHEASGGLWVGWPGLSLRVPEAQAVEKELEALRCVPVPLSRSDVQRYYDGFSNRVLWPLFHYLADRVPLRPTDWNTYRRVNQRFARAVEACYQKGDLI